jgi:mRNA interferase RelE/StbE
MYQVIIEPKAQKSLDALNRRDRARVAAAILRLADGPFADTNVKALTGGGFRMRVSDYRVLFGVEADVLAVVVVKIGHRREVYRAT